MRAGAALTPGDSSLLKERDKHPVYLCFVLFIYICVFECAKGKVCLTNPPVHCESYVFVTLTMAR